MLHRRKDLYVNYLEYLSFRGRQMGLAIAFA